MVEIEDALLPLISFSIRLCMLDGVSEQSRESVHVCLETRMIVSDISLGDNHLYLFDETRLFRLYICTVQANTHAGR